MSAFIAGGPPSRVIEEVVEGNLDLVLLEPSMIGLARVLREKFDFDAEHLEETEALLRDVASGFAPTPAQTPEAVTGDPDDDLILECAVEAGVGVLVSGDRRHLLPVGEHGGVRVLTPQAFLAELRSR